MTEPAVKELDPKEVWENFAAINAIPRASKKEERIIEFMVKFGKNLGLETTVDPVGNVIIRKPATPGMENRKTVVMQSHLDMVHQKNADSDFDFENEGIKMLIEGDWVKADGTTLGADNGLGVAAIMGVLRSSSIAHPALEALFTIDEETGMTGAQGLQPGYLEGEILLNLDTEEDDEIDIGCAGGIDVTAVKDYQVERPGKNVKSYRISVTGLQGGHSGMDIHKGLGNANKIMNGILVHMRNEIRLGSLEGGSLRNAIPRESFADVVIEADSLEAGMKRFEEVASILKKSFSEIEPSLEIRMEEKEDLEEVLTLQDQNALLESVGQALNGVFKMSPEISDLVEASNNIAKVTVKDGTMKIECLTRSSVEDSKKEIQELLRANFEKKGFEVSFSGSYPGWSPNGNSPILKVLKRVYTDLFSEEPKVVACHAGLECGIIGSHYPGMDMISFGPTIKGAHSPDERASITSVKRFWGFLLEILKNIPSKN
jgi:dipeptidase D